MSFVLLIEDSPSVSSPLRALLELDGYEVAVCEDAASAIELMETRARIDIALVDYWLEEGTAESALAALHARCPDACIVLITGGRSDVSVETTRWLGALDGIDGFLQKPFTRQDIQALFRRLGL